MTNTGTLADMLVYWGQLEKVEALLSGVCANPSYDKLYGGNLRALARDLKKEIARRGEKLPNADIRHFLFAATHKFHKKDPRRAFQKLVKTQ